MVELKKTQIILDSANLEFKIYQPKNKSLRNYLIKNQNQDKVTALKDINLKIVNGERVGLIGKNGSGKSTLLRVVSGIYNLTSGTIKTTGSKETILDNNIGIELDATGFENIYIILLLTGFTKSEIDKKIDWIVDFSGLEQDIFRPLRTYSNGMITRLVTSSKISSKSDILILDEFFGMADKEFSNKVNSRFNEIISDTGIFLCASHNDELLKKLCNRIIELKDGKIISDNKL
jgi:lipopolysaccharide transport system ATP-binding protein